MRRKRNSKGFLPIPIVKYSNKSQDSEKPTVINFSTTKTKDNQNKTERSVNPFPLELHKKLEK